MQKKYDYYVYPSLIVLDEAEVHKYFGIGGAGRRAFAHDYAYSMPIEIYKYDINEGQFVERMEEWEKQETVPQTLPKVDT